MFEPKVIDTESYYSTSCVVWWENLIADVYTSFGCASWEVGKHRGDRWQEVKVFEPESERC
jgi:hypothetical protein